MSALPLVALALLAAPLQDHSSHGVPAPQAEPDPHAGHAQPAPAPQPDPHAGHGATHQAPRHDAHAAHGEPAASAPAGTDLPPGQAPAPDPEPGRAADRFFGAEAMAVAEGTARREHGAGVFHQLMLDRFEYRAGEGRDRFHWEGEAWYGGDIDRLWLKSEGEAAFGEGIEAAEVQALYSRALDPYWNLQAGIRQDLGPGPRRSHAVVAVEGLAPYWFELGASLYLSDKGDLLARAEGHYDQRVTEALILQPSFEFDLAAQDVPENAIGAGLSRAELGLRLRYEIAREFAPYVGVAWERSFGRTADLARARGEGTGGASLVVGVRAWF